MCEVVPIQTQVLQSGVVQRARELANIFQVELVDFVDLQIEMLQLFVDLRDGLQLVVGQI